ncbi:MAG: aminopeptidase, partial [Xylophilus sp.]|nr:aminopeptidase [Xylophilus sp.]
MVFLASGAYGTGASSYSFNSILRALRNIRDGFSFSARWPSAAGLLGVCVLLSGCADTGYYAQSVKGHLQLMHAAKPVATWLDDPATPAPLKTRLVLAQRIRSFAATDLRLPDNASYHRYADLQRKAVVW